MDIVLNIDLEKFRYSLIGDGYLKEEVLRMSEEHLLNILKQRIHMYISEGFKNGKRIGLYD